MKADGLTGLVDVRPRASVVIPPHHPRSTGIDMSDGRSALLAAAILCLLAPGLASADPACRYQQLRKRLLAGMETHSVLSLAMCRTNAGTPPPMTGGTRIDGFLILPGAGNESIAYADQHFTVRPDGTPVIEFLQYRVASDGTAAVTMRTLSPTTFQPLPAGANATTYQCMLGRGLDFAPALRDDKCDD
jgi:hypothetical protein